MTPDQHDEAANAMTLWLRGEITRRGGAPEDGLIVATLVACGLAAVIPTMNGDTTDADLAIAEASLVAEIRSRFPAIFHQAVKIGGMIRELFGMENVGD